MNGINKDNKSKIYYNIWCCAYQRRYNAKVEGNWDLYDREQETILMCLSISKFYQFDSDKPKNLLNYQ